MKKLVCWFILLAILLAPCALASDYTRLSGCDILRRGSRGDNVRRVQQALVDKGYLAGGVDGSYGAKTEAAVRSFQAKNGITASGVCTMFTQAKLFGTDALFAWNNTNLYNYNTGMYDVANSGGRAGQNDVNVWFDFINRDTTPVEAICIYCWLADSSNYVVKRDGSEYWMQWYYNMNVTYGSKSSVNFSIPMPSNVWRKFSTVRCIVGEIAYNDGTVVVTMNTANQPYGNPNYILMYN